MFWVSEYLGNLLKCNPLKAKFPALYLIWAALWQNQQSECAPSEDSDQPGHPPGLIRVFAVHFMGS